jgi:hypothetical protein
MTGHPVEGNNPVQDAAQGVEVHLWSFRGLLTARSRSTRRCPIRPKSWSWDEDRDAKGRGRHVGGELKVIDGAAGSWKPFKYLRKRIDGIVALIMALERAARQEEFTSVYSKRGVLFITMSAEWVEAGG